MMGKSVRVRYQGIPVQLHYLSSIQCDAGIAANEAVVISQPMSTCNLLQAQLITHAGISCTSHEHEASRRKASAAAHKGHRRSK